MIKLTTLPYAQASENPAKLTSVAKGDENETE